MFFSQVFSFLLREGSYFCFIIFEALFNDTGLTLSHSSLLQFSSNYSSCYTRHFHHRFPYASKPCRDWFANSGSRYQITRAAEHSFLFSFFFLFFFFRSMALIVQSFIVTFPYIQIMFFDCIHPLCYLLLSLIL